ncbi:hypothetical protein RJ639_036591 [Escallonia herrerae]|uniref:Apple domain-containing protein n=1 Tax=Escallonia herrerae TaxID=1293975 RepID=A0AA88WR77_9ASTE|nr:hypothetical protein RJ639_036591 [Escallonia herrerae]
MCRQNCSCMAYSSLNITGGGSGCVIWGEDLVDMRQYAVAEGGQDLYVRVAAADSDSAEGSVGSAGGSDKTKQILMVAGIIIGICFVLSGVIICFVWKRKTLKEKIKHRGTD